MTVSLAERITSAGIHGTVLRDEPMSRHTSLGVGGPADFFILPADLADLERLLAVLADAGAGYLVVGAGYNLLVRDGGIRGAVISLERFDRVTLEDDRVIRAGAGADNRKLAAFAAENLFSGLEFLAGIPGRLGGALAMNAGAGDQTVTDNLQSLVTLGPEGLRTTPKTGLEFGYRYLKLAPDEIIIEASFRLERGSAVEIGRRTGAHLAHRSRSQRVGYPSAGSFFRNPEAAPAWRLIDQAGLRGCRIGGAQVSEVHANFLVNRGGATAADFLALAGRIKEAVKRESGVELEEEVRIAGED